MAYQKILADDTQYWRYFYMSFDNENPPVAETEVRRLPCSSVIYSKTNKLRVELAYDENLIKTNALSPYRTENCDFKGTYLPGPKLK